MNQRREPSLVASEAHGPLDALDDEDRAWSTDDHVMRDLGAVSPFKHTLEAERWHIDALLKSCTRDGITPSPNRGSDQVPRYVPVQEACTHAGQGADTRAVNHPPLQSTSAEGHLHALQRRAARG